MTMRRDIRRRLREAKGFSLTEALVTLAILVFVSMVMATAVPAAYTTYRRLVDASNAHLLLATTSTRLRDELSVANPDPDSIDTSDAASLVAFESLETGFETSLVYGTADDADTPFAHELLYVEERMAGASPAAAPLVRALVPERGGIGSGSALVAKVESITYADGVFSVSGLRVTRVGEDATIAGAEVTDADGNPMALEIRVLASPAS